MKNCRSLKFLIRALLTQGIAVLSVGWLCGQVPAASTFKIEDLGKKYVLHPGRLLEGMYYHIQDDASVIGGNTSIRNVAEPFLVWKGSPDANGFGYFQRNRDLGQVFTVKPGHTAKVESLVIRTSKGNNAVMQGAPGAEIYVVFYEVGIAVGNEITINENGTTQGDLATHGFDTQFNRCDDYIEGATYKVLYHSTGGVVPDLEPTDRYLYDQRGKGEHYGEQPGHLRYLRLVFSGDVQLIFEGGKQYAFLIGFKQPGKDRGLALAIDTEVHEKAPCAFVRDANGFKVWGIRREGDGTLPPTRSELPNPPGEKAIYTKLVRESLFPEDHFTRLHPTSNGYPDVDTYRTLQYYLELSE